MMKRSMRKWLSAALVAGALTAVCALSASAEGLVISVCDGSEDAMVVDPQKSNTLEALSADRHLYEGLYKLDEEGNLVLGQAASEEISEDGLTVTYTLRDDITWSDGVAVTAGDFVYAWQYLVEAAGDYSGLLDVITNAEAADDQTLVLTLAYKCAYLPSLLAFPSAYPAREDIVTANGDAYATDPDKAVYNGAYEMTEWVHQSTMVMTKRADYYDADRITVDEIDWQLMTDSSTKMASFQSGEIIYSDGYPEEQAASLEGNGLQFVSGYMTYCAMFNLESGDDVLKDARVRKALSLAVDRDRLMSIRDLHDVIANTYTPGGLTNSEGVEFNSTVDPWFSDDYAANCEEAKALLAEAGYENGEGFPSLRYIVGNEDRKQIAEAIVSDWKEVLGIDSITVETTDNFFSARKSGDYDIAYFGWYMDYVDISNMLNTMTTGSNDAKYSSEEYDAAFEAAISASDEAAQWEAYAECEAILAEDVPVAPLFHADNSYLFDDANYDGLVYYCGNIFLGYLTGK